MALSKKITDSTGTDHDVAYIKVLRANVKNSDGKYLVELENWEYNSKEDKESGKAPFNVEKLETLEFDKKSATELNAVFGLFYSEAKKQERYLNSNDV